MSSPEIQQNSGESKPTRNERILTVLDFLSSGGASILRPRSVRKIDLNTLGEKLPVQQPVSRAAFTAEEVASTNMIRHFTDGVKADRSARTQPIDYSNPPVDMPYVTRADVIAAERQGDERGYARAEADVASIIVGLTDRVFDLEHRLALYDDTFLDDEFSEADVNGLIASIDSDIGEQLALDTTTE